MKQIDKTEFQTLFQAHQQMVDISTSLTNSVKHVDLIAAVAEQAAAFSEEVHDFSVKLMNRQRGLHERMDHAFHLAYLYWMVLFNCALLKTTLELSLTDALPAQPNELVFQVKGL